MKVKVMLRVSGNQPDGEKNESYLSIDKKKKQVTLSEPTSNTPNPSTSAQDRGPMVSAPKMFAFDALHTKDDSQVNYHTFTFECQEIKKNRNEEKVTKC